MNNDKLIYFDYKNNLISISKKTSKQIDKQVSTSLWVLISFLEKVSYHSVSDFPISISFMHKESNEIFEIINVQIGKEDYLNNYFYLEKNNIKKILILEDLNQKKLLRINNIYCYAIINVNDVQYFQTKNKGD